MSKNDVSNEHTIRILFSSHSLAHLPAYSSMVEPCLPIVLVHFVGGFILLLLLSLGLCVECSHDCTTRAPHSLWTTTRQQGFDVCAFLSQFIRIVRSVCVFYAPEICLGICCWVASSVLCAPIRFESKSISNFRIYYALDPTNVPVILVDIINNLFFIVRSGLLDMLERTRTTSTQ